jgi:hypothetical protein
VPIVVAAALALALASGLAAAAGSLLAPRLTPEAKLLMLALAPLLQGGGFAQENRPSGESAGGGCGDRG